MEDYIKYIAIGAFLLFRFILAGKKKQESANKTTSGNKNQNPQRSTPSLDDILREFTGESPRQEEHPTPMTVKPKKWKKQEIEEDQYDVKHVNEHLGDSIPSVVQIQEDIAQEQRLEDYDDAENFDLRQAIIAQTILTRPEY
jgi:hypothetical protein